MATIHAPPDPDGRGTPFHDYRAWYRIGWLSHVLACWLERTAWHRLPTDADPALADCRREAECVVAFHVAVLLRSLLIRLLSGFTMALGGVLLVMAAHLFYAFQGRAFWLGFDWMAIGGTSLAAILVLVHLERDAILSRLWNTTPGRVNLTSRISFRMAAYAAITVVTLFASFFPEVSGNLLGWLEPVRKALP